MKRTRSMVSKDVESESMGGDVNERRHATAATTTTDVKSPSHHLPASNIFTDLSTEAVAVLAAPENLLPRPVNMEGYTPAPPSLSPPVDQMETIRALLFHSIKTTHIAAGWVARWPRAGASIEVFRKFSNDLFMFFALDGNAQALFPNATRRATFLEALGTLRAFFETHHAGISEYVQVSNAVAEFNKNKLYLAGKQRLAAIQVGSVPPLAETFPHEIHTYFVQAEETFQKWFRLMDKADKLVRELYDLMARMRLLLLAEVPPQVREILWPGEQL